MMMTDTMQSRTNFIKKEIFKKGNTKNLKPLLENISRASSAQMVYEGFEAISKEFEFSQIALALFNKKNSLETFSLFHTYPQEWEKRYNDLEYYLADPVYNALDNYFTPFQWHEKSFDGLTPKQHLIMSEAADFGVKSGMTIPLIPSDHYQGFATFLNQERIHSEVLYILALAANTCVERIIHLYDKKILDDLSSLEREILKLKHKKVSLHDICVELKLNKEEVLLFLNLLKEKLQKLNNYEALLMHLN